MTLQELSSSFGQLRFRGFSLFSFSYSQESSMTDWHLFHCRIESDWKTNDKKWVSELGTDTEPLWFGLDIGSTTRTTTAGEIYVTPLFLVFISLVSCRKKNRSRKGTSPSKKKSRAVLITFFVLNFKEFIAWDLTLQIANTCVCVLCVFFLYKRARTNKVELFSGKTWKGLLT